MTVCHPTPNSPATAATDQSWLQTCSNAHLRARAVIAERRGMSSLVSVHVFCSHHGCRQTKILLRQQICTGTPEIGGPRPRPVRRSFTAATAPHVGQPTRSRLVCTSSCHSPSTNCWASNSKLGMPNRAVTCPSTWGPLGVCIRLVVNTDPADPRPHPNGSTRPACRPKIKSTDTQLHDEEPPMQRKVWRCVILEDGFTRQPEYLTQGG